MIHKTMNTFEGTRVLVTGGAGFIGSHLVEALVHSGALVTVLDDLSTGKRENLSSVEGQITFIEGSILDAEKLSRAMEGVAYVVHLAAFVSVPGSVLDPLKSHEINVTGTLRVLLNARDHKVRRVVCASSSAVYGSTEMLPCEESAPYDPESLYATQKMFGEEYAKLITRLFGVETVRLRFFNVYGPRQNPEGGYAAVIPVFAAHAKKGKTATIYGDGNATRDFVYVGDVANALILAIAAPDISGSVMNVASGTETTITELARLLNVRTVNAPAREGDIMRSVAEVARAEDALGFRAQVSLKDGLGVTLQSYD